MMPSLVYAPVSCSIPAICFPQLISCHVVGVLAPRSGDEHLHVAHRPSAIRHEAQAFHLHIGESSDSKASIWHESMTRDKLLVCCGPTSHNWQITFIFILILFIDSVNRVYRVQVELAQASKQGGPAGYLSIPPMLQQD